MEVPRRELDQSVVSKIIKDTDTFIFDCDGVLWHGQKLVVGAHDTLKKLKDMGKKVLFVTNNSTKSTEQYKSKFISFGIDVESDTIYGTAAATALYLKNVLNVKKKIYMIGNKGMKTEIEACGIDILGYGAQPILNHDLHTISDMVDMATDDEVEAVVVGFDSHFNLQKLSKAILYLQMKNMPYIATNTDAQFPMSDGRSLPGTGAIVAAVTTSASRPPIVIGKPERNIFAAICTSHDVDSARTMMIGDRLDTDILFGKNCGLRTLCVLSGVTSYSSLFCKSNKIIPDYYANSINDFQMHF